jgi:iron(III) transport system ATP-binding protein
MRFELKALHEALSITTVYVTHDQEEALALSDRIGVMHEGALLEVGTPTDLYLRPAHKITADFLGSSNFIPARVQREGNQTGDEMLVESPLGSFLAQRSAEWRPGMPALLFFRPEYVEFVESESCPNGLNGGHGVVERVTFLGNSADVVVRCGDTALRARAHPARTPAAGRPIGFSVAPISCTIFPASSASSVRVD